MRRLPGALAILAGLIVVLAPVVALACPSCATREGPGLGVWALIGAFVAVPYGAAVVVLRIVRNMEKTPGAASAKESSE